MNNTTNELPWYEKLKGTRINSMSHFRKLMKENESDSSDKLDHVHFLIEFFMYECPYCEQFASEWNDLVSLYESGSKKAKVKFLKVNNFEVLELTRRFKVDYSPTFIYVRPESKGKKIVKFDYNSENLKKEQLIEWLDKLTNQYAGVKEASSQIPDTNEDMK